MFKAIVWNIRGVRNKATRNYLSALNCKHTPDLLAILEPKIDGDNLPSLAAELHMPLCYHGGEENKYIWLMWKDNIDITISETHSQFLTCLIKDQFLAQEVAFTMVYASCLMRTRRVLRQSLSDFYSNCDLPWLLVGDFNVVSTAAEKSGPRTVDMAATTYFNGFISANGLMDAGYQGSIYTWCTGLINKSNTWERLDRVLYDTNFLLDNSSISVTHLTRLHSDHSPLLISPTGLDKTSAPFRFQRMWTSYPTFMELVTGC